jgi:polyvinyl alcohol dehydrogenase (cytochrome)
MYHDPSGRDEKEDAMRKYTLSVLVFGLISTALAGFAQTSLQSNGSGQWTVAGQNLSNTRSQPAEHRIGPANVNTLTPKWVFTAGGNISATPTVAGNAVYFPDWAGNLYAVDRQTGALLWSRKIVDYDGVAGAISRVSPAVYDKELILGDIESVTTPHNGANVMAVDRATGALLWITKVDSQPAAQITGSPVVYGNVVYQGVSSSEETLAINPGYPCCTFRGSVVALDARSGQLLWKTYDLPDNGGQPGGYSGGAIWQIPAIDPVRGSLYIGTGNAYTAPESVLQCLAETPQSSCFAPDVYFDTALSLDLKTGAIKWSRKVQAVDIWTVGCILTPEINCENPSSPDFDFGGSGPNLLRNIVGFGQKSGIYWALNPTNGDVLWKTQVGPGGTLGGIEWGTATDGSRIYAAIGSAGPSYTLVPSGTTITWGSWSALDVKTGKILWQVADPTPGTIDTGAVSVANGVLYAGSYSGKMYALDASTGKILWNFISGGSVIDGPSIVDDFVYWGSGYSKIRPGTANNKLYAFSLAAPQS